MIFVKNNGLSQDNAVQNRFTAYLLTSISHCKAKYLKNLHNRSIQEISLEVTEQLISEDGGVNKNFDDEISDDELLRGLNKLTDRDKNIVFKRAVSEEPFVKIAADMNMGYSAVKAVYRRSLDKIRKELKK